MEVIQEIAPAEQTSSKENILANPPGLILVFDNYRGPSPEQQELALATMRLRAEIAALIYKSDLYSDDQRPDICCFAGEHRQGEPPGSRRVKSLLLELGIPEGKITTRETTITTRWDMIALHSLEKSKKDPRPLAIVTTDDHVPRTWEELKNHFNRHRATHGKRYQVPTLFVISPASKELDQLNVQGEPQLEMISKLRAQSPLLDHGLPEKAAYIISTKLRPILPVAEKLTHPYTPPRLERIKTILSKKPTTVGELSKLVKK